MKRRHFISLGFAAIGTSAFRSDQLRAAQRTQWQADGAGSLARIGVLTPDDDPVPESEMWTMAPQGVSIHTSRVPWNHEARSFAEPPHVDSAAELLARLTPRVVVYAFTSSSYVLGAQADDSLRVRLEKHVQGIPVVITCQAAVEAFRTLSAHRVAVINPPWFTEEVNSKGMDYFRTQGFEVVLCARITPDRQFTEVPPAEVYEWTRTHVPREAEVVFIAGNGLRAVGAIHSLEESLRRPVLSANQVAFWKALRIVGMPSKATHYGRIFSMSGPTR